MPRLFASLAVFVLTFVAGSLSVHAQQVDTAAADTAATDPLQAPTDSVGPSRADTLAADSLSADTPAAERTSERRKEARQAAQTAAEEWLALIDGGDFEESWTAADSTLRAGISQEDWADQGIRSRVWLDTLHTRRLQRAQYRESTSQIPGGHPVVILEYASEYAKGPAREAVITTKRDTAWAVAGYRVVSARGDSLQADTTQAASSP